MTLEHYEQYLKEKKPNQLFQLEQLKIFEDFLQNKQGRSSIDIATPKDIEDYFTWQFKYDRVPRAKILALYYQFMENPTLIAAVKETEKRSKSRPRWIDNLSFALDDQVGEAIREEILQGREGLKQTSASSKKRAFAKEVINRMEEKLDKTRCKEILSCGLHRRSKPAIDKLRRKFQKVGNLDKFLEIERQKELKKWSEKGEHFRDFVRENPDCEFGVRNGDLIYVCKVPFHTKQYQETEDEDQKRIHYCHCSWVKGASKEDDAKISPIFCYCGAGWYRQVWEGIFNQPVKVNVVESVLGGGILCRFAVHIPPEIYKYLEP